MSVLTKLGLRSGQGEGRGAALGSRVGALIAKGDAEIGVQQITELLQIPGIDSWRRCRRSCRPISSMRRRRRHRPRKSCRGRVVKFLSSEPALPVIKKVGLQPG